MVSYKIVCCPKCHRFGITTADVSFCCLRCSKTSSIDKLRVYFQTDSGEIARKVLQRIIAEKEGIGEDLGGFVSAK